MCRLLWRSFDLGRDVVVEEVQPTDFVPKETHTVLLPLLLSQRGTMKCLILPNSVTQKHNHIY